MRDMAIFRADYIWEFTGINTLPTRKGVPPLLKGRLSGGKIKILTL
ncbi:MAG: hypothetical protein AB1Z23_03415 [Eubacteriales bacterium]